VTRAALGLVALFGLACASPAPQANLSGIDHDPWQRGNRRVFGFNEGVDRFVLWPVARGWTAITPESARVHLGQFFANLAFPRQFLNSLLQAEPYQAGVEFWRFAINTTVGLAGFFDPASEIGLIRREEDFGQTLGVWGIGSGRYVMLPLLGPSTLRDTAGLPFDMVLNGAILIPGAGVVRAVNARALAAKDIDAARESALDFYAFVRNAYLQLRRAQVSNESEAPAVQDDDLYEVPADEP
jgi:phospholipid-binding lipoprotein MlaA